MSSEKPLKRLIFRWTALKGLTAIVLFFILALLLEYIMVYLFLSSGLTDEFLISQVFQIPGTSFSFTITISTIFHLVPLGVIVVLVASWTYLTKYIAVVPRGIITPRKAQEEARRKRRIRAKRVRFKRIRQLSKKLGRRLRGVSRRISSAVHRIRGVSYVLQRLSFAKATIKSAAAILAIFVTSVVALSLLSYPSLVHDRVIGLYEANSWFHGFVLKTLKTTQAIGGAFSPLRWVLSSMDNVLHTIAPGFRSAIEGFGALVSGPFVKLDLLWKYAICQNAAAWISAVAALTYGQYASRLHRRYKR